MHIVKGMPVGRDGRVRTTLSINPSTLRFASSNPNMQNAPRASKENPWPGLVKHMFVAPAGYALWELDFSAIEGVLVGYFANSRRVVKAAKLGIHAFLASHIIGNPASFEWEDNDLRAYFKTIKKEHDEAYNVAKRIVHSCLTPEHEILTPKGWVRFDQYSGELPVAQWDNGVISFVNPSHITCVPNKSGTVHCLHGRSLSAEMTDDHRIPYQIHGSRLREVTAATLPSQGTIPVVGELDGTETINDDFLRLVVATQADGAVGYGGIVFHLVKPRKLERLRGLLATLNIDFTDVACACHPEGRRIRIRQEMTDSIMAWLDGKYKTFDLSAMLRLSIENRRLIISELVHWDGSVRGNERYEYFTTNYEQAKVVQTLAATTGIQSLVRFSGTPIGSRKQCYTVSFNKRTNASVEALTRTVKEYTGNVYCVTVPSGWFMIRHNDRISVTGNSNYLTTPRHIHNLYPEIFPTIKSAAALQEMYFGLFPEIPAWHKDLCLRVDASRQRKAEPGAAPPDPWTLGVAYAKNPFGYAHRFYHVLDWEKIENEWVWHLGDDAKRLIAFLPQSTAAGILRRALRTLWYDYPWVGETFRLIIHDAILGECRVEMLDEYVEIVRRVMESPIPELPLDPSWGLGEFLTIGCESKTGTCWGDMH